MNINIKKEFIIGSYAFFNNYDDYKIKDIDKLCILDKKISNSDKLLNIKIKNKDIFLIYDYSKNELIENCIKTNIPLAVGKFIVPEYAKYINLTIDDLKKLENLFNKLDNSHSYEKIIYNSYIENNDFTLSKSQLDLVYNEYKKTR